MRQKSVHNPQSFNIFFKYFPSGLLKIHIRHDTDRDRWSIIYDRCCLAFGTALKTLLILLVITAHLQFYFYFNLKMNNTYSSLFINPYFSGFSINM